jgi:hypothetical protein
LKFPSTNIVGGGLQSLAAVPAYNYLVRGTGQASTIIVSGSYSGKPTANLVLQSYVFTVPATVPAGLSGSRGGGAIAATATTTFSIQKNGVNIGTMVFAAIGHHGDFRDERGHCVQWR